MTTTPDQLAQLILADDLPAIRLALAAEPRLIDAPESSLGWPPLRWAAYHGCNGRGERLRGAVAVLLEYAGQVDLHTAALLDRGDLAARAVAHGADVEAVDADGLTALHLAAERGSVAVAKVLLDQGADPNRPTPRGETALALAAHPGPLKPTEAREVVDLLRAHGAEVDLHSAAMLGDTELLTTLLDARPTAVDTPDAGGATALFHAAHNLRLAAVDLLLARGADAGRARPDGQTPLSAAVDHRWDQGGEAVVARLLAAGPTVDLFSAAQLGMTERVVELVEADPALLATTRYGYGCLYLTAAAGHAETVGALLRLGADPNEPDPYHGATPLHEAANWGRLATTRVLLEGGADPALTNRAGQTAEQVARDRGWDAVAAAIARR